MRGDLKHPASPAANSPHCPSSPPLPPWPKPPAPPASEKAPSTAGLTPPTFSTNWPASSHAGPPPTRHPYAPTCHSEHGAPPCHSEEPATRNLKLPVLNLYRPPRNPHSPARPSALRGARPFLLSVARPLVLRGANPSALSVARPLVLRGANPSPQGGARPFVLREIEGGNGRAGDVGGHPLPGKNERK